MGLAGNNFRADFHLGIFFLGVGEADFLVGVGDFFDDGMHGKNVHLASFLVELGAQIFFGLVILSRGDNHRVFDRRHHHFRLNVLFATEHFNLLVEQIRHFLFLKSLRRENNIRRAHDSNLALQNSTTRFALRMASSGISTIFACLPCNSMRTFPSATPAKRPSKNLASLDRLGGYDLGLAARESARSRPLFSTPGPSPAN